MSRRQTKRTSVKESPAEYRKSLRAIGRESARDAVRENKALGLPVTYINRGRVIQEQPDGKIVVLSREVLIVCENPEYVNESINGLAILLRGRSA